MKEKSSTAEGRKRHKRQPARYQPFARYFRNGEDMINQLKKKKQEKPRIDGHATDTWVTLDSKCQHEGDEPVDTRGAFPLRDISHVRW